MKCKHMTQTILICTLVVGGIFTLASCGKEGTTATTTKTSDTTKTAVTTVAVTTASLPTISGTLATNDMPATWTETAVDPAKTMYVKVESDYLKIRKGPGTDYEQIGTLTNGMTVTVIAKTDTNWYKLQDGYYVSGDYLTEAP